MCLYMPATTKALQGQERKKGLVLIIGPQAFLKLTTPACAPSYVHVPSPGEECLVQLGCVMANRPSQDAKDVIDSNDT